MIEWVCVLVVLGIAPIVAQADVASSANRTEVFGAPRVCRAASSHRPLLLVAVRTSPQAHDSREAIRSTWGVEGVYNGVAVRRVFFMGSYNVSAAIVKWESVRYHDILQWAFVESPNLRVLKEVLFWRWQKRNCSDASYVARVEDDVFLNQYNLASFLKTKAPSDHLYGGEVIGNSPPYVNGIGIVVSHRTAAALDDALATTTPHSAPDVYIGQALLSIGVHAETIRDVHSEHSDVPCVLAQTILQYPYTVDEILRLCPVALSPTLQCTRFREVGSLRNVVLVVPIRNRMIHYVWQMQHLKRIAWPRWNVTVIVVEQAETTPFRRGWLLNVGIQVASTRFNDDTCVVSHDVDFAVSPAADYGATSASPATRSPS